MLLVLLALFIIIVPIVELYLLIQVGNIIGAWNTVSLVLMTSVIGVLLAKTQGRQVLKTIQHQLQRGELPTDQLLQGLLVFAGALLLIIPGFFTDAVGLTMLVPPTRGFYARVSRKIFQQKMKSGSFHFNVGRMDEYGDIRWSSSGPKSYHPSGTFDDASSREADVIDMQRERNRRKGSELPPSPSA